MDSIEHIHGRRQRSHRHIFPPQISAHQHREADSVTCRPDILAPEHCLSGQWVCKLCQDCYQILAETSISTEWVEDSNCEYIAPLRAVINRFRH